MKDKILILGKGFMGQRIQKALGCNISGIKIYNYNDAESVIKKYSPKILINCIGYPGRNNVDDCEEDLDKTIFANTFVPILLAEAAIRNKVRLIHISSGCIYHYDYAKGKPIREDKAPDFFDLFYSRTKFYADEALRVLANKFNILIIRTRIPLDIQPHPKNLLTRLIKYKSIINLPNSVIYMPDLIGALRHLIKINATGIYNVVNKGGLRYSELMDIYKKYVPDFEYKIVDFSKLKLVRTNLILSTRKLEHSGFKIRDIEEVLEECVKGYLKY